MPLTSNPKQIVRAVLLNERGEVLVLKRSDLDDERPGDSDFPGGGVEESDAGPASAIIREVLEETGLEVPLEDLSEAWIHEDRQGGVLKIRYLFAARLIGEQAIVLNHREHQSFSWLALIKVYDHFSHPIWMNGLKSLSDSGQLS